MRKKTQDDFLRELRELSPNIEINSEYINNKTKVSCTCTHCGYMWMARPDQLLLGKGCPNCNKPKKVTKETFIERSKEIHDNKYDYSKVEYKTYNTKVIITCPIHGDFGQTPHNHLLGQGCPKCGQEKVKKVNSSTTSEFIEKARKVHGNQYDYSKTIYINNITPVIIICPKHGEFLQKPLIHLKGCGCPICRKSHGELLIRQILNQLHINYIEQYTINGQLSYYNKPFRVDFYITDKDNIYIIEYNGIQHYQPVEVFGGMERYNNQKLRDNALRQYCNQNNINLIEIDYSKKDNEIQNILEKHFNI